MSTMFADGPRTVREVADELLETQRVEYLEEGELIFVPPAGFTHLTTLRLLTKFIIRAFPSVTDVDWELTSENFQWEFGDGTERFSIPDMIVAFPGATSRAELRENIALIVEITSPKTPKTVKNDKGLKPKRYAKAGVPFYLLVDQQEGSWTLHELRDDWPGYQIHSTGEYGKPIELPAPFGFAIPTDKWPAYSEDGE